MYGFPDQDCNADQAHSHCAIENHASLYLVECKMFYLSLFSLKIRSCCTLVKEKEICKKVKCN